MPESASDIVLGIDFGMRRIGLATGNRITGTARALNTIHHRGDPWPELARVIREWGPGRVVIGLPLAADGSETDTSGAVRVFAAELHERHPELALSFQDERHSSRAAGAGFVEARRSGQARRKDAARLDSVAAALIVESWLAEHGEASA